MKADAALGSSFSPEAPECHLASCCSASQLHYVICFVLRGKFFFNTINSPMRTTLRNIYSTDQSVLSYFECPKIPEGRVWRREQAWHRAADVNVLRASVIMIKRYTELGEIMWKHWSRTAYRIEHVRIKHKGCILESVLEPTRFPDALFLGSFPLPLLPLLRLVRAALTISDRTSA